MATNPLTRQVVIVCNVQTNTPNNLATAVKHKKFPKSHFQIAATLKMLQMICNSRKKIE